MFRHKISANLIFPCKKTLADFFWNALSLIRYKLKRYASENSPSFNNLSIDLNYINLDSRDDRKIGIEKNLKRYDYICPIRFAAISHSPGGVGCTLSHLRLLLSNINSDYVCIAEDDFRLISSPEDLRQLINDFLSDPALDVLCIGNNQMRRCVPISNNIGLTTSTQTTSMYIAKRKAIPVLIKACLKSIELYSQSEPYSTYAIDQVWKKSQKINLNFGVPLNIFGFQEEGFSNIEMKHVDYKC